ncbi:hypothetical protein [Neisseria sp. Ec49-e6-T10]|uniref:hypothetical protein n=1 Tax=Neisseria sp. Ec49-e6-T10 TaxID=3140744 RepID=UPI003EBB83A4
MNLINKKKPIIYLSLATLLTIISIMCFYWLKTEYKYQEAQNVTEAFLSTIQQNNYEQAWHLTLGKKSLLGNDFISFQRNMNRQLCTNKKLTITSSHPYQSNGNRLRRLLTNKTIDMPSIGFRLRSTETPSCLISIEMRQNAKGEWRIYNFQSTAG